MRGVPLASEKGPEPVSSVLQVRAPESVIAGQSPTGPPEPEGPVLV